MNEGFPVIAAGGLPQKCPVPQCRTKSREKQPPSNPTKTAIDPKIIRTGESPRSGCSAAAKCPVPQCVFTDADGGAALMQDGFPVSLPPRAEG